MVSFQREKLADIWDDVMVLCAMHWEETEQYQSAPLNPDKERYLEYNEMGYHRQYTARDGEKVVGHLGVYISTSMHTQVSIATEDTWYLMPEYRRGRNAMRFYQFIEEDLRKEGVYEVLMHAKNANNTARLMEFLGYKPVGTLCIKRL